MKAFTCIVSGTQLIIKNKELITSGSRNQYEIEFQFDEHWFGLVPYAIFAFKDEKSTSRAIIENTCIIPYEYLIEKGSFEFGVYALSEEKSISSRVITINVYEGALSIVEAPEYDEVSGWEEYHSKLEELFQNINSSKDSIEQTISSVPSVVSKLEEDMSIIVQQGEVHIQTTTSQIQSLTEESENLIQTTSTQMQTITSQATEHIESLQADGSEISSNLNNLISDANESKTALDNSQHTADEKLLELNEKNLLAESISQTLTDTIETSNEKQIQLSDFLDEIGEKINSHNVAVDNMIANFPADILEQMTILNEKLPEKKKVLNPNPEFQAKGNTNYIFTQIEPIITITLPAEVNEIYCDDFTVNFISGETPTELLFDKYVVLNNNEIQANKYYEVTVKNIGKLWVSELIVLGEYISPTTISNSFIQFDNAAKNLSMSISSSEDCEVIHCGKNLVNFPVGEQYKGNKPLKISIDPSYSYTVSLSQKVVLLDNATAQHWYRFRDISGELVKQGSLIPFSNLELNQTYTGKQTLIAPSTACTIEIDIGTYYNSQTTLETVYCQVETGTVATDYEEFLGTGQMLSANVPIEVNTKSGVNSLYSNDYNSITVTYQGC